MNNGKLIRYFRSHLYAIVSNMTHFLIPFGIREKNGLFRTVLMQNLNIWNFHSLMALNNGKIVWYFKNHWYAIVSNMTHFDNSHSVWNERKNALFEVNSSFLDVSEQFSFHVSKHFWVSKAQQTRVWLLPIVVDEFRCLNNGAKTHVFWCFGFSGTRFVSVRHI